MANPRISIIMPVHNVAPFLDATLKSVLSQDFENYELILVDDGSTDGSSEICDCYATEYHSKIKVFHTENKGVSNARNFGIKRSSGEYIYFMDSDDLLSSSQSLSQFYRNAECHPQADLIVHSYIVRTCGFGNETDSKSVCKCRMYKWRYEQHEFIDLFLKGFMFVVWNKLFKRDIIISNNIFFKNMRMEDFDFVLDYISSIDDIYVSENIAYLYFRRYNRQSLVDVINKQMIFDYSLVHKHFYSLFDTRFSVNIDEIMFPQYYHSILKFINNKRFYLSEKAFVKKTLNHPLIKASFRAYRTASISDYICCKLIGKGLFSFYRIYRSLIAMFR